MIEPLNQMRLVRRRRQRAVPLARMRQRADQQMRRATPAPRLWRIRQIQPVPLGFRSLLVFDDRDRALRRAAARLADRGQSPRSRMLRVDVAYEPVNPSSSSSSTNVRAHRCGSSRSRAGHVVDERLKPHQAWPACAHPARWPRLGNCGLSGGCGRYGARSPKSTNPACAVYLSPYLAPV